MATNVSRFTGLLHCGYRTERQLYGRKQIKLISQTVKDTCIQPARRLLGRGESFPTM